MNPHSSRRISLLELLESLRRNRQLIFKMTRRDVVGRYSGSMLGLAWSFFNPLLMLVIYTFVFSVVFKSRWEMGVGESKTDYAMLLFTGMIMHGLFAECVNRAPTLILSNVNYVKKVIFPLEILPWVSLGSALFHAIISLVVLLLLQLLFNQNIPWTVVLFPLVLLPLILATMGFAWFLASLGVYVRDIGQVTGIFTTALLFLSCVFYPLSSLPEKYQYLMKLNPLAYIIEGSRDTLIFGRIPDFSQWLVYFVISTIVAWLGFAWFQRTRGGFADVI
ncbi:ABC transporter permease [Rhodanobacter thiooxydans]|uniref:Transport permease protein n=1 Tax=Rhodanobacter thiooxydans TaxID=416169 RepID=A0A154QN32_9GAMM|nr:ABC transporter permease [Rhodanobacter thiooxydans]KZC25196.1 ABC transporter permease [Rhodanobacter thiooxydans]